jgi:hypothetical protein
MKKTIARWELIQRGWRYHDRRQLSDQQHLCTDALLLIAVSTFALGAAGLISVDAEPEPTSGESILPRNGSREVNDREVSVRPDVIARLERAGAPFSSRPITEDKCPSERRRYLHVSIW